MKSITKGLIAVTLLLSAVVSNAQIKNSKTDTVKIFGNCGMCETKIEKAGTQKNIAAVDWDKNTKMATLIYDSKITNKEEILKRIALVGYDSEKVYAEETAYRALPSCCQYVRAADVKGSTVAKTKAAQLQQVKNNNN
jgi:hypothetical protein